MVRDVCRSDAVVQKVEHGSVRAIDSQKGAADGVPVRVVQMRNVDVGVLEPGIEDEPKVDDKVRADWAKRKQETGNRKQEKKKDSASSASIDESYASAFIPCGLSP